jgi:DNA-directed RNA polymerase specialized sigma24 family protein
MFRVAHNVTIDFLHRRALERGLFADAGDALAEEAGEAASLAMRLYAAMREAQFA